MAACGGANLRSRSAPRRPGTPYSFAPVPSTTARRDPLRTWAGSRLLGCTRARGPGAHDGLYWICSRTQPPWARPQGVGAPLGRFYFPRPFQAERAWGRKERRHKGSARAYERRKVFAVGETRRAVRRSLAELSERPLRGRLPVLHCCPFARFPVQVCCEGGPDGCCQPHTARVVHPSPCVYGME